MFSGQYLGGKRMKGIRILICDKDESYTSALVRYLVGSLKGVRISYDTSLEAFRQEEGEYRIALMILSGRWS